MWNWPHHRGHASPVVSGRFLAVVATGCTDLDLPRLRYWHGSDTSHYGPECGAIRRRFLRPAASGTFPVLAHSSMGLGYLERPTMRWLLTKTMPMEMGKICHGSMVNKMVYRLGASADRGGDFSGANRTLRISDDSVRNPGGPEVFLWGTKVCLRSPVAGREEETDDCPVWKSVSRLVSQLVG